MSSARKRTDLIERTRYPNPLPLPPYPPKLLSIPTPATRYADPTWSSRLAESVPLPLVVDAEGGMPLDLNAFPELWATDERGRPIPIGDATLPPLDAADVDAEDAWLLDADLANAPIPPPATGSTARTSSSSSSHLLAASQGDPSAPVSRDGTPDVSAKDVAWLRRTEYLGADRKARAEAALRNAKPSQSAAKDVSPESEVARINDTFAAIEKQPLGDASLRHPNPSKRHLEPVECLDVFPDFDTWATDMHIFKFADAPSKHDDNDEATAAATSSTLPLSILRPRTDNMTRRTLVSMYVPSSEPTEISIEDFDRLLLADEDAFVDDEERELYGGPEGDQLDKEARMRAVVRREEMRRRKGWVGQLPVEPEEIGEEGDEEAERKREEFLKLRAEVTTPYRHQRDYDPERQGVEEDLARLLVLSFDAESDDQSAAAKLPLTEREATYLNSTASSSSSSASRAVYYHPITSRTTLRVKRQRRLRGTSRTEDDEEHWTDLALTHRDVTDKELVKRLRKRVEVEAGGLREDELPELSESEDEAEEEEEVEETPKANGKNGLEEDDSAEAGEEEEPGAAARRAARARAAFSDDEDEEEEAGDKPAGGESSKKADAPAADEEEEEDDDEGDAASKPRKSNRSDSGSSGEEDDDDDDDDDDDIDADEELAALREEAGDDAPAAEEAEEEAGEGRSRRSRRAATAAVAAPAAAEEGEGEGSGEAGKDGDDDDMDED